MWHLRLSALKLEAITGVEVAAAAFFVELGATAEENGTVVVEFKAISAAVVVVELETNVVTHSCYFSQQ